jgi:hypothetical protein
VQIVQENKCSENAAATCSPDIILKNEMLL